MNAPHGTLRVVTSRVGGKRDELRTAERLEVLVEGEPVAVLWATDVTYHLPPRLEGLCELALRVADAQVVDEAALGEPGLEAAA